MIMVYLLSEQSRAEQTEVEVVVLTSPLVLHVVIRHSISQGHSCLGADVGRFLRQIMPTMPVAREVVCVIELACHPEHSRLLEQCVKCLLGVTPKRG